MIQLTRTGFVCDADVGALRNQFERAQFLRLPKLIDAGLTRIILGRIEAGKWDETLDPVGSREVVCGDAAAVAAAKFAANTPGFLRVIREITGCDAIVRFNGRIYRMVPGGGHYDVWHDDWGNGRLIGMSVNLGTRPYYGGVFQFRKIDTTEILGELPNTGLGDAILFGLSEGLEHRITPMEGTEPKTALAGWFESATTDYFSALFAAARHGSAV
jgi:hypothetical protein